MSTNTFTDEEVEIILETLKAKSNYTNANEKDKLTIQVEIARKLTAKLNKGRRSALQVRYKLLQLQKGYNKLKEKPNYHNAVNRQAVKYFKLLDDIFALDINKNQKIAGKEIVEIDENGKHKALSSFEFNTYNAKEEFLENGTNRKTALISKYGIQRSREGVLKSNDENCKVRQVKEFSDYSFKVPQSTKTESNSLTSSDAAIEIEVSDSEIASDLVEHPVLSNVRKIFTKDLLASQNLLVEAIKEQDQKYVRSFKAHCMHQATVLRRDRYEIKNILSKDRKEMVETLRAVLNAMGRSFSYQTKSESDIDVLSSSSGSDYGEIDDKMKRDKD